MRNFTVRGVALLLNLEKLFSQLIIYTLLTLPKLALWGAFNVEGFIFYALSESRLWRRVINFFSDHYSLIETRIYLP